MEVAVRVTSDPGRPLRDATVIFNGQKIAATGDDGVAKLRLSGRDGEVFPVTISCPSGYLSPKQEIPITLRRLAEHAKVPEYTASCPPTMRTVVVVIRADNGPNLPIRYRGKTLGRTDASGAFTWVERFPPDEQVNIEIDTSERERLRPVCPKKTFRVKQEDDVVAIDEHFTQAEEKVRPPHGHGR
jgi:hypothetical protein